MSQEEARMDDQLDQLAFKFFKIFAQYESTLKEMGYFRSNNGRIIVNWDRFANEIIGSDFQNSNGEIKMDIEYILEYPPMKQTVNSHGEIIWKEISNEEKNVQILFSHISRIRNNLFHGAKFNGTWFDPERSYKLLTKGFSILDFYKGKLEIS